MVRGGFPYGTREIIKNLRTPSLIGSEKLLIVDKNTQQGDPWWVTHIPNTFTWESWDSSAEVSQYFCQITEFIGQLVEMLS